MFNKCTINVDKQRLKLFESFDDLQGKSFEKQGFY